jgi:hypothetical protein
MPQATAAIHQSATTLTTHLRIFLFSPGALDSDHLHGDVVVASAISLGERPKGMSGRLDLACLRKAGAVVATHQSRGQGVSAGAEGFNQSQRLPRRRLESLQPRDSVQIPILTADAIHAAIEHHRSVQRVASAEP